MKLDRKILRVEGADRARFLGDLVSIAVSEDMPLRYGALLTPQGKILSDLFLWGESGALCLDLPVSTFDAVLARLNIYRLRADVDFVPDDRPVLQLDGEGDPRGDVGRRVYGADGAWDASAYLHARIRACVPEFGVDFQSDMAYPREWRFDEMNGIDYQKGCFVGQEVAARMRHKSQLLKSVVRVRADVALEMGTEVLCAEKSVGRILSSSGNEALAFLRLKGIDLGAPEQFQNNWLELFGSELQQINGY